MGSDRNRRIRSQCIKVFVGLAVGVAILAYAVPKHNEYRCRNGEASAISGLRTLSSAEETFRSSIMRDADGDGAGEYGTLSELAGLATPPGADAPASPPFLDNCLGGPILGMEYSFVLAPGEPAPEGMTTTEANEHYYYATAVPKRYGKDGRRTFFLDQSGVIRGSDIGGDSATPAMALGENPWPVIG